MFTSLGKKRLFVHIFLFFLNTLVLALSARVNHFQEFFFVADLFPLALSIITLVYLTFSLLCDLGLENPITGRAPFEIGVFGLLSIFWLAFNAFSTSRWRHVPLACSSIPNEFPAEITWCKDLQALKSFIWIEWLIIFLNTLATLQYTVMQHNAGNNHIWTVSLARYTPNILTSSRAGDRDSEFLPFEKLN